MENPTTEVTPTEDVTPEDYDFSVNYDETSPESTPATPAEPAPAAPAEEVKPTEPALTPEAIAAAVRAGMTPTPSAEPEKELTEDEIDSYLKRAKYSVDDLKALGLASDDDEAEVVQKRVQVLSELQNRAVQQAVATAQVLIQHHMQEVQQEYSPVLTAYRQQQQQAVVDHFYTTYPDLKNYEELVRLATAQAKSEGILDQKSLDEQMKLVAAKSAEYVKKYSGTEINLSATPKSPTAPAAATAASAVPRPASVPSGGRSQQPAGTPPSKELDEFSFYDK